MKFLFKLVIGITIWLMVIEVERTNGFAFFGSSLILALFLAGISLLLIAQIMPKLKIGWVYLRAKKTTTYFGALLISVFFIQIVYFSITKRNFRSTIEQIENYKNTHGVLPQSLADLPNPKSNVYAFLEHDFIYESEMYQKNENGAYELKESSTDRIIGYKTPMGEWRYRISPQSESYDYIFYDD